MPASVSFPSAHDKAFQDACKMADQDFEMSRPCEPSKHGALPRSAWATWYRNEYKRLSEIEKASIDAQQLK